MTPRVRRRALLSYGLGQIQGVAFSRADTRRALVTSVATKTTSKNPSFGSFEVQSIVRRTMNAPLASAVMPTNVIATDVPGGGVPTRRTAPPGVNPAPRSVRDKADTSLRRLTATRGVIGAGPSWAASFSLPSTNASPIATRPSVRRACSAARCRSEARTGRPRSPIPPKEHITQKTEEDTEAWASAIERRQAGLLPTILPRHHP